MGAAGLLGILLVVATTAPALGQSYQQPVTVYAHRTTPLTERVPYGDLALATKAGRAELTHRVGLAVGRVCPDVDDDGTSYDVDGCKNFAWAGAWPQMKRAFALAKSGVPMAMSVEITAATTK
jgi:UrcA family protein